LIQFLETNIGDDAIMTTDLLLNRKWVNEDATATASFNSDNNDNSSTSTSNKTFVFGVAQWNILADSLSDAFPQVLDKKILSWEHRFPLIVSELRHMLGLGLVVCAEEMDHFQSFQHAVVDLAEAVFIAKEGRGRGDGSAIFVPRHNLELLEHKGVNLVVDKGPSSSQVVMMCRVRARLNQNDTEKNKKGKSTIVIASTHLKAKVGFEVLRQEQTRALLQHLEDFYATNPSGDGNGDDVATVIGGDFNDIPDSLAAQAMREHGFRSAYESMNRQTYTTSKIREALVTRCIDYLWYKQHSASNKNNNDNDNDTSEMDCIDCITIPPSESLGPTALPRHDYPSDHLMIAAKFELLVDKE
jgi:mRNA deadenylase 3'-5' endonuclease subunit Ccr4